jgi:flagellar hook-length control protein FliK
MLNAAHPAAPGPQAVLPLPGGAPPDTDAGPVFALALDRATSAATASDVTAADLLSAMDPTAAQPPDAEARPGGAARSGSRKVDLAESLAEAPIDTSAASTAPKPDDALPVAEGSTVEPAPGADDAQTAELIAWVANLPLPPPTPAAAPVPTPPPATQAAGTAVMSTRAASSAAVSASAVATTPTLPLPAEATPAPDSAPAAAATPAMPQAAAGRRAEAPDPRGAAPGITEASAQRGDAVRVPQWLAAQRETLDTGTRTTADSATALPALSVGVTPSSPRPTETSPPVQAELHAELGSKEFAPALGSQLKVLVRDGVEHAQLKLNPAEMGPIEVRIRIDGSQAQVEFSAAQAPTRQALQEAVPALASALRDAGLTLSGGGVFDQARDPRGEAQPQARQGAMPSNGRPFDEGAPLTQAPRLPRARGAVDLYA